MNQWLKNSFILTNFYANRHDNLDHIKYIKKIIVNIFIIFRSNFGYLLKY